MTQKRTGVYNCNSGAALGRKTLRIVAALILTWAVHPVSADSSYVAVQPRPALPEAMLVPVRVNGQVIQNGGWTLTFRNYLQDVDAPDSEIQFRHVGLNRSGDRAAKGMIVWDITRTVNSMCRDHDDGPCPDKVRVLSVPDGYAAVLSEAYVKEGGVARFLIIPAGMS